MFKAAIFDMDGLLLDSERVIRDAWLEVAGLNRIPLTEAAYLQVVGRNEADSKKILEGAFHPAFTFETARETVRRMLDHRFATQGYPVKRGAIELLNRLRALQIPCGVASSTPAPEVRRRLDRAGLLDFFGSLSGGDEVERGKPDPALFLLASERVGLDPRNCLVFEDSEHGAAGAVAAGMSVALVPDLKTPAPETRALCVAVLPSLSDALPQCDRWFAHR